MVMANTERFQRALDLFRDGLRPSCEATWRGFFGDDWLAAVNGRLHTPAREPNPDDVAFLLKAIKATWKDVFSHGFAPGVRSLVFAVSDARNGWAHQEKFGTDDTLRALDDMERLLEAFGNIEERRQIKALRRDLMRQMFDEGSRSQGRRSAAKPTEGQPQAGLPPWRDVIAPHSDVASGRFEQAEFAADLFEVANPEGRPQTNVDPEYHDPVAFFARTYLTSGLSDLLLGAARRLSGQGGDPVVELQTNFGGGKTHSMIALYHLASGVKPSTLPGVGELLGAADIVLPPSIARAVLVGGELSVATPLPVADGTSLHTLWGHLAWQLGGPEGYELVRRDDEAGTNPGAALRTLFDAVGPAIVLIDEWVAYARQLRDGSGDDGDRLAGGDFDTQFTFAQTLTEAAASAKNVVVLVSIPASDIEVGGEFGRRALERLKNVVTRKAAQWQPASADESFEIVRRRLFDPITDEQAKQRDRVVRAFSEMYRTQIREFPSGCGEADYRRRLELSYPIHPELFDRLFRDWSALDKFQRTRGVLRMMAVVISEQWQRGDQSLLIMPGNLPLDSGALVSELKKYLEDAWDAVIKSDVDGPTALPLKIDQDNKHFGRFSAARRVARSAYMGSAPRPDGSRGVDLKSIMVASAQPGEPVAQFADALRRLAGEATHLYVDGAQYWYSLQPNMTRVAADRAASNYDDRNADDEVRDRLKRQRDRGAFQAMHVFAGGPGDVPDDDTGARLVVLSMEVHHDPKDLQSPALAAAERILRQRDAATREFQNLLVFAAADARRAPELRNAARLFLAWQSVLADEEALQLTTHQRNQAKQTMDEKSRTVDSLIGETYRHVLVPSKAPGTADVEWATLRCATEGELAARVTSKLASEELLIRSFGGVRVRMDLDRHGLWSERGSITVQELWRHYARLLYMSRLASREVLYAAISQGMVNTNWEQETFAYADAFDEESCIWFGVRTAEHVNPIPSGHIVRPDVLLVREMAEVEALASSEGSVDGPVNAVPMAGADDGATAPTTMSVTSSGTTFAEATATSFYAQFQLDSVRGVKQLAEILEHVAGRLGAVDITLEIRAANSEGFDDATRRIVSENANNLGAASSEFE